MNSRELHERDEFGATLGRELKRWGDRQGPPAGGREAVLRAAAQQPGRSARRPRALIRFQHWLASPYGNRRPKLPSSELSRWLFSQAMWQNLGIDRRAVRFVC